MSPPPEVRERISIPNTCSPTQGGTRWKKATPAILDAVAAAVKKAPTKASGVLGQILLESVRDYRTPKTITEFVPLGSSAEDLVRHAAFILLHTEVLDTWHAPEQFPKRAKALGLDVVKIVDQVAPKPVPAATSGSADKKKSVPKGKKT